LINELDLKIKASEGNERIVKKQGSPKIGVSLDYILVGDRTDILVPDNGKNAFMPMASVSLPIFRSKYKSAQKEALLMREAYALQKEELINNLRSNYESIQFEIQRQWELAQLYESQAQDSERSLNLLFVSYSNSGEDYVEVLRMQQQVVKYRKLKASALSMYQIKIVELDYITAN
jgi:outer membrane protein TolC